MRLVAGSERHSGFGALVCAAERVVAVQGHVSHAVGHEPGSLVHHWHDVAGVLQRTSGRLQDVAGNSTVSSSPAFSASDGAAMATPLHCIEQILRPPAALLVQGLLRRVVIGKYRSSVWPG